ncbi:MAG: phospholipase D family protein [Thermodesulfobacteriota bacterium]
MKLLLCGALLIWLGGMAYGLFLPLPQGVAAAGPEHQVAAAEFLYDLSYLRDGTVVREQRIFNRILAEIAAAERFVVLDMFLFNGLQGPGGNGPPLSETLVAALLRKRQQAPQVAITVLSDPINTGYGSYRAAALDRLRSGGVAVITTDLTRLRDSNPLYSGFWRPFLQWFGNGGAGWLTNPFSSRGEPVTLRSWLALLNFKANHRKVLITDQVALVTSANPHDASGHHSNIALIARGAIQNDLLASEAAVADFSGAAFAKPTAVAAREGNGPYTVQLLTESAIKERALAALRAAGKGETVWLAMFYLAERRIRNGLLAAAARGATVRLILDPNKDAFGRIKNGIPNRQVASWLVEESGGRISVRWYDTHGEQFHPKLLFVEGHGRGLVIGGSANFTRRNLDDYNLETDLAVSGPATSPLMAGVTGYCRRLWENRGGQYTLPFAAYREEMVWKRWRALLQEASGLGTF